MSNKRPRETEFWDRAESFAPTLLGHVYRMYASSPDFGNPTACWCAGTGVSLLLLSDGSGHLVVSSCARLGRSDRVRHATMPLKLMGAEHSTQKCIKVELEQFKDRCTLHGESGAQSNIDACRIVNDFACEILDDSNGWNLKLYPSLGGHSFRYDGEEEREEQTTRATDIIMTTPNCDELGHFLFRKTGEALTLGTLDAAVANEVAAWDTILSVTKLAVGDKVRIRKTFESGTDGGGKLAYGLVGSVKEIDEDGDAHVDFGAGRGKHWILAGCFNMLSKLSGEEREKLTGNEDNDIGDKPSANEDNPSGNGDKPSANEDQPSTNEDKPSANENELVILCKNMDCERYPPDWDFEEDTEDTYVGGQWQKCNICDGYFNDDGCGDILFVEEEPNNQKAGCSLCGKEKHIVQMKGTGQYICGNACDESDEEETNSHDEST